MQSNLYKMEFLLAKHSLDLNILLHEYSIIQNVCISMQYSQQYKQTFFFIITVKIEFNLKLTLDIFT